MISKLILFVLVFLAIPQVTLERPSQIKFMCKRKVESIDSKPNCFLFQLLKGTCENMCLS
jgi:hypothetical protein